MFGRKAKLPIDILYGIDENLETDKFDFNFTPNDYADKLQEKLNQIYKQTTKNRDLKMNKQKLIYDRKTRAANYSINDKVWVKDTTTEIGKSKKLSSKWKGPYTILNIINKVNYVLKPDKKNGRQVTVHQNRLKKCYINAEDITNSQTTTTVEANNEIQDLQLLLRINK